MGLYILIPLSVVLVFVIGIIFWWSVRSGQYDDLKGPAVRLLMDDEDDVGHDAKAGAEARAERCKDKEDAAKQHPD